MMTHRLRPLVIVVVAVLIAAVGVTAFALRGQLAALPYVSRALGRNQAPALDPMKASTTPVDKPAPTTGATLRGDVAIDPRRQQLIGVRPVAAIRSTLSPTIRTIGP